MRRWFFSTSALVVCAAVTFAPAPPPYARQSSPHASPCTSSAPAPRERDEESDAPGRFPNEWFLRQRAWPQADVDQGARLAAFAEARALQSLERGAPTGAWEPVGPTNVGGRIADLACHPTDPSVLYVGAASGGVFKSTDTGATWVPTFDDESSLSIGCVTVDPGNPETIWVGTGEPNGGGGSVTYGGTGVFRSTNGGVTWTNMGLADTRFIGRIVVDPTDGSRVFVAALGSMWSQSPNRGVYRTTDGGASWQRVLASTDSTGAVDIAIHPLTPSTVYAVLWERSRHPNSIDYGGPTSGIFRSTDGGDSWVELTSGLPTGDRGRIGITLCKSAPATLYAVYAESNPGAFAGLFKTTNGGTTWVRTNDAALAGMDATYGWWFGNLRVAPNDPNRVYVFGLDFYRTTNGGTTWSNVGSSMHVDHHALAFAADGRIFEGNDGGLYTSTTGTSWNQIGGLAISQFYTVAVNAQAPQQRYGGLQDNGTQRTLTGAANDWASILGGDGHRCLVDPLTPLYIYAEAQYGDLYRSANGGSTFTYIASSLTGRINWSMPVEFDPSAPATLYAGTNVVYRSTNRGTSWSVISPDLTDGAQGGNVAYDTITTLAVAPTNGSVILAGTDDANVWITTNGGGTWARVDGGLPQRWITRVAFDPTSDATGYVTVSGFRWDEPAPHVFRTTDHGGTWADISGNLPQAPVNDVVVDPSDGGTLYVGTDFGVYRTTNGGASWAAFGTGLPNTIVTDLQLHQPTRTLVAASYGRSMWTFDLTAAVDAPDRSLALGDLTAPNLRPLAPNPARESVDIRWVLPRAANVSLEIYDVAGRRVITLAHGAAGEGLHARTWNRRAEDGARVAAGVYFVRLAGDGALRSRKLVLLD